MNLGLQAVANTAPDRGLRTRGTLIEGGARKAGLPGSGVLRLLRRQLELVDHSAELGKRTGVHLPHRPAAVDLHRGFGDADIAGNLFAQATARDLNHDLALPGAQRFEALPETGQSRFTLAPGTITREAELNGVEEFLIPEGLRQELKVLAGEPLIEDDGFAGRSLDGSA